MKVHEVHDLPKVSKLVCAGGSDPDSGTILLVFWGPILNSSRAGQVTGMKGASQVGSAVNWGTGAPQKKGSSGPALGKTRITP